jgi:hypothetical protein
MLPLAVVTAVVMLCAWFPLSALWHQQSVIDQTGAQIAALNQQDRALQVQSKSVSSAAQAALLAREQYQLVSPGQSLIQVLPGDSAGQVAANTGDPGFAPLVAPSSITSLSGGTTATRPLKHGASNSFVSRFVRTLEFWR